MESTLLHQSGRELHDILGHSLTRIIFMLRRDRKERTSSLLSDSIREQCLAVLSDGIARLEEALSGRVRKGNSLSIALGAIIEECYLFHITFDFVCRGPEPPLPEPLVAELSRCCREGITNAIKHGSPKRIDIVLLFGRRQLVLLLVDNGIGSDSCTPGSGLEMMRHGLSRFGADLTCWSEPDTGFQLTIRVPYSR